MKFEVRLDVIQVFGTEATVKVSGNFIQTQTLHLFKGDSLTLDFPEVYISERSRQDYHIPVKV